MNKDLLQERDEVEVEPGQVIADIRSGDSTLYRVVYADDSRVLLRSNKHLEQTGERHYRCDFRDTFDQYVIEGRYERRENSAEAPSMPAETTATEMDWSEVDYVGEGTEEKLYEAGIKTDRDLREADDDYVIEVYGMSEAKLKRMKEFIL